MVQSSSERKKLATDRERDTTEIKNAKLDAKDT